MFAGRIGISQSHFSLFKDAHLKIWVIIDCAEICMPTSFRSQSATYSSYKKHFTAKTLIGISPACYPKFVSEVCKRSSGKQIAKDCGILNLLEPGDDVMADRGFDIEDNMPDGVGLNTPPYLSVSDEVETRKIAAVKVHVETTIARIKCFRIKKMASL